MNEIFFPLNTKTAIKDEILEVIENKEDWQPYYNFIAKQLPDEIVQKDPFLRDLYAIEPFVAGVTKMNPMTVYDWHVDERRGVSLNMLIDGGFSLTLYTTYESNLVRPIRVAEYAPDQYHLFNTQMPHAVFNFDKPRYLFTLEFQKDKTEFGARDLLLVLSELEGYELW